MSIIKIKRSGSSGAPAALAQGEFAYSYLAGTEVNGGDRLYLGTGTETGGVAANIEVIGGKYFTDKLDHTPGTLTANSSIIVDANSKIDVLNVDNITIDGNSITSTNLNGDIVLDPNGTGSVSIVGPLELTGNTTFTGALNVTDDLIVGANVMIVDAGTRDITIAGDIIHTGNNTITGTLTVTGVSNFDNLAIDGNTLSSTDTDGNIFLDPNGTGYVQAVGTNGFVIPTGNTAQQGPNVAGSIRFNSEINQFEGYSGTNWSSLGGVRSVDGLTYIIAESSPAASDDTLYFYAATSNTTTNQVATLNDISFTILNGTSSTSTSTGSLVVQGGAGISENLNVGGNIDIDGDLNVDGGDITTNQTTFNVINTTATTVNAFGAATLINIGADTSNTHINDDLNVDGNFKVGGTNFTVDSATGDVTTTGDVVISGDLTVNGNTTTVNVSTLEVEDALIRLASNNTTDAVDIGFVGNFNDGAAKIAGLFRNATDTQWYLFDEYVDANIDDNVIDTTSNTFSLGVLNVDYVDHTDFVIQLTGDVAGNVTITDIGSTPTYTINTTVQPDSVALGNDTTGDYVATITANTATGVSVTGTGEGAAVTVAGVIADTAGQVGVATYNALNFDVSAGGEVTIDTIDGGTY